MRGSQTLSVSYLKISKANLIVARVVQSLACYNSYIEIILRG